MFFPNNKVGTRCKRATENTVTRILYNETSVNNPRYRRYVFPHNKLGTRCKRAAEHTVTRILYYETSVNNPRHRRYVFS